MDESHKIHVLVLEQYERIDSRKPTIIKKFDDRAGSGDLKTPDGRIVNPLRLNDFTRAGEDSNYFGIFRRALEDNKVNLILAFVTPDNRNADSTGNLWLELGYLIARKGDCKLLVVSNDKIFKPGGPSGKEHPAADSQFPFINVVYVNSINSILIEIQQTSERHKIPHISRDPNGI